MRNTDSGGKTALRTAFSSKALHGLGELVEGVIVTELARHEPDTLADLLPHRVPERGARVFLHGLVGELGEILVLPVAPGEAHQGEARRQQAAVGQVIDGWQQLLARQVAGDAEDDQHAWPGDPGNAPVTWIPQRVLRRLLAGQDGRIGRRRPAAALARPSWRCRS
jgi:hypothetical protein